MLNIGAPILLADGGEIGKAVAHDASGGNDPEVRRKRSREWHGKWRVIVKESELAAAIA